MVGREWVSRRRAGRRQLDWSRAAHAQRCVRGLALLLVCFFASLSCGDGESLTPPTSTLGRALTLGESADRVLRCERPATGMAWPQPAARAARDWRRWSC